MIGYLFKSIFELIFGGDSKQGIAVDHNQNCLPEFFDSNDEVTTISPTYSDVISSTVQLKGMSLCTVNFKVVVSIQLPCALLYC